MEPIRHGVNGWDLVALDVNLTTGARTIRYERVTASGLVQSHVVEEPPPLLH